MKHTYILAHKEARIRAVDAVMAAPDGYCITVSEPSRNLEQNAAQWPILQAFAAQLAWPVNGVMSMLTADEWKDVLTAAFHGERVQLAQGMNGGTVMIGLRTSTMGKHEFSEWLEFLKATAADRGVDIKV